MNGKTYTLRDASGSSEGYYRAVAGLADGLLADGGTSASLRDRIRRASSSGLASHFTRPEDRNLVRLLHKALASHTHAAPRRRLAAGLRAIGDPILATRRDQYHLFMLEIELTNRINGEAFRRAAWRMALMAHCLRDFHPNCAAVPGDVEETCARCRPDCLLNLAGELAKRHGINPYIAATMDHERLFGGLARRHPGMAVMGIACVPELVMGLRLVESLGIPGVGVPLDANRCARWCGEAGETAFSLAQAERLMRGQG